MAQPYDIKVKRGIVFLRTLTLKHADGTVRDLTGYSARLRLRSFQESSEVTTLLSANGDFGLVELDGKVELRVPGATSTSLAWVEGKYLLDITDSGGESEELLSGSVRIVAAI